MNVLPLNRDYLDIELFLASDLKVFAWAIISQTLSLSLRNKYVYA